MNESTCSEDHKEELRQVMRTVHPGGSSFIYRGFLRAKAEYTFAPWKSLKSKKRPSHINEIKRLVNKKAFAFMVGTLILTLALSESVSQHGINLPLSWIKCMSKEKKGKHELANECSYPRGECFHKL